MKNPHQVCRSRDGEIKDALTEWIVLDMLQIWRLLFPNVILHTAQRRMGKLFEAGKVKRNRLSFAESFCYYLKKPTDPERIISLNWIRLWLRKTAWGEEIAFDYAKQQATYRMAGETRIIVISYGDSAPVSMEFRGGSLVERKAITVDEGRLQKIKEGVLCGRY